MRMEMVRERRNICLCGIPLVFMNFSYLMGWKQPKEDKKDDMTVGEERENRMRKKAVESKKKIKKAKTVCVLFSLKHLVEERNIEYIILCNIAW